MMKDLNIGENLIRKRKEKGITQDELARFIGVSKASVSKWETGHSYPDVVFLPQLAAYFDISLDELMGYEPQMTDDDIRKLYVELLSEFATKPFAEMQERCRELAKKYYSCFLLLYQLATLLANYAIALGDEAQKTAAIIEAKLLLSRVKEQSDNSELRRLALMAEASCEMLLNAPNKVVSLLENESRTTTQPSVGALLSGAYQMLGNPHKAKLVMQDSISSDAVVLFYDLLSYLPLCGDDSALFEETCRRLMALRDSFQMERIYPAPVLSFYLAAAESYAALGNREKAIAMLEAYADLAVSDIFPLGLKADGFFTLLDEVQERQLKESSFVMPELPRDESAIKQDIVDSVVANPAFAPLSEEARFKMLSDKLRTIL
jgi:transcriptional regulator with XRE-family HTH domain